MLAKVREKLEDSPELAAISAVFLRIFRDNRHERDNREAILAGIARHRGDQAGREIPGDMLLGTKQFKIPPELLAARGSNQVIKAPIKVEVFKRPTSFLTGRFRNTAGLP